MFGNSASSVQSDSTDVFAHSEAAWSPGEFNPELAKNETNGIHLLLIFDILMRGSFESASRLDSGLLF